MRKFITQLGLAALVLSASEVERVLATDKEVPCVSDKEVKYVASEIPKHFKQVRPNTYLIKDVPKSKNGYRLGGQLTVLIPQDSELSIFDRTDANPSSWYNVANTNGKGCAYFSIYLTGKTARYLSNADAQTKFNAFVHKVEDMIK